MDEWRGGLRPLVLSCGLGYFASRGYGLRIGHMEVAEFARLGWGRWLKAASPMLSIDNHEFVDREKSAQRPVASFAWLGVGLVLAGVRESSHARVGENQVDVVIRDTGAKQALWRLNGFAHGANERPVSRFDVWLASELRVANVDEFGSRDFFHKG
jgi:hypothetical protein